MLRVTKCQCSTRALGVVILLYDTCSQISILYGSCSGCLGRNVRQRRRATKRRGHDELTKWPEILRTPLHVAAPTDRRLISDESTANSWPFARVVGIRKR